MFATQEAFTVTFRIARARNSSDRPSECDCIAACAELAGNAGLRASVLIRLLDVGACRAGAMDFWPDRRALSTAAAEESRRCGGGVGAPGRAVGWHLLPLLGLFGAAAGASGADLLVQAQPGSPRRRGRSEPIEAVSGAAFRRQRHTWPAGRGSRGVHRRCAGGLGCRPGTDRGRCPAGRGSRRGRRCRGSRGRSARAGRDIW